MIIFGNLESSAIAVPRGNAPQVSAHLRQQESARSKDRLASGLYDKDTGVKSKFGMLMLIGSLRLPGTILPDS